MQLQEVGEGHRQLRVVLELHLHLHLELSPALLTHLEREVIDHYPLTPLRFYPPRWFCLKLACSVNVALLMNVDMSSPFTPRM